VSKSAAGNRKSKRELRREQMEREKRLRTLKIWVPITVIVVALVALVIFRSTRPEIEGVTIVDAAIANQHDDTLDIPFGSIPPLGGPHAAIWQNCGIYDTPVSGQFAIHSMEHGAVWITYNPELPADQIATLQDMVRGEGSMILNPYPNQTSPIVMTVWDRQLELDSVADARVAEFIGRYKGNRGPEAGARCSGGVGTPIG